MSTTDSPPQSPEWVAERVDGTLDMLYHQYGYPEAIRLADAREAHRLVHGIWFCTPDFIENGEPLGFYRLTVKHPADCECPTP